MSEQKIIPQGEDHKYKGDDELCQYGGNGGACDTHHGKRTDPEDEYRVQHHVDD